MAPKKRKRKNSENKALKPEEKDQEPAVLTQQILEFPLYPSDDEEAVENECEEEDQEEEEEEVAEEEEEPDRLKTLLSSGLSDLTVSIEDLSSVYNRLNLTHQGIEDIGAISQCPDLRHINFSHNNIEDLAPLGDLRYLITLNCSHNCLSVALDFSPGYWLTVADFSHNSITDLPDISGFWALTTLRLDFNQIQSLEGIQGLMYLRVLTVSNNELRRSDGIQNLPLRTLDLSQNKIETTELLHTLGKLRYLDMSWNRIEKLRDLNGLLSLRRVSFRANLVADIAEIDALCELPSLESLDLRLCPVADWQFYRPSVLFHMPQLIQLDQTAVSDREIVAAQNMFSAEHSRLAAVDHAQLRALRLRRPAELAPPLGCESPLPWEALVLVGPPGAGKTLLLHEFLGRMPKHLFGKGISHTCRPRRPGETSGKEYIFVTPTQFALLHSAGHMLETSQLYQARYGLSEAMVRELRRKGRVLVTHMDLAGALSLQRRLKRVQLILVLPQSESIHRQRLSEKERTEADPQQERWRNNGGVSHISRSLVAEELVKGTITPRQAELEPSKGQMTRTASLYEVITPQITSQQERRRSRIDSVKPDQITRAQEVTSPLREDPPDLLSPQLQRRISSLKPTLNTGYKVPSDPETRVESTFGPTNLQAAAPGVSASTEMVTSTNATSSVGCRSNETMSLQLMARVPESPSTGASQPMTSATSISTVKLSTPVTATTNASDVVHETCNDEPKSRYTSSEHMNSPNVQFIQIGASPDNTGDPVFANKEDDVEEKQTEPEASAEVQDIVVPRHTDSLWSVQRSWFEFPMTDECSGMPQDRLTEVPSYGSFSMIDRWARAGGMPSVVNSEPYLGIDTTEIWEKNEPCLPAESLGEFHSRVTRDPLRAYSHTQVEEIIKHRDAYLVCHQQHPGLFLLAVNSDQISAALSRLCDHLYQHFPLMPQQQDDPSWAWMERVLQTPPVVNPDAETYLRHQLADIENAGPIGSSRLSTKR